MPQTRVRNIARGGGRDWKVEVQGLKELERKLRALSKDNPDLVAAMYEPVSDAAAVMRENMVSAARMAGWDREVTKSEFGEYAGQMSGAEVIDHIFSYARPKPNARRWNISAIVGVTKKGHGSDRGTMVSWRASKHPKSPNAKKYFPDEAAMSFATMLEFGTIPHMYKGKETHVEARPAIRNAIEASRGSVINALTEAWNGLLERFSK